MPVSFIVLVTMVLEEGRDANWAVETGSTAGTRMEPMDGMFLIGIAESCGDVYFSIVRLLLLPEVV